MKKSHILTAVIVLLALQVTWLASAQPLTCTGSVILSSQADVNAFSTTYGCTEISGNLTVSGNDITNLDGLQSLTRVGGNLVIENNLLLTSVAGLSSLTFVGFGSSSTEYHGFQIEGNANLTNLNGLNALAEIEGMLRIFDNASLINLDGLASLSSVGNSEGAGYSVSILRNPALISVAGLGSLTTIPGQFDISANAALLNLDGLHITTITGLNAALIIGVNASLTNIDGLSSLTSVDGRSALVAITDNPVLTNLNGLQSLTYIEGSPRGAALQINNNASLVDVDGLSALTSIGYEANLAVTNNPVLTRGCGLYPLLNAWNYVRPQVIDISGNGPGVTKEEILAGGYCTKVCSGNIALTTQAEVDAFPSTYGCTEITGSLTITGNDITNLDGLHTLRKIGGNFLLIDNPNLVSITGLSSLTYVGSDGAEGPYPGLHINNNAILPNLNGFNRLTEINGLLEISNNALLANVDELSSLVSIGAPFPSGTCLIINGNPSLANLNGFRSITRLPGHFFITDNDALQNLHGFDALTSVGGSNGATLQITGNESLISLEGLNSLTQVSGRNTGLGIFDNPKLLNVDGLSALTYLSGAPNASLGIRNNASLQNVDGFSHLTSVGPQGSLTVVDNHNLTRGCGLYPLLSVPEHNPDNFTVTISGNGTGFSEAEILAGGPCPQPCLHPPMDKYVFAESAKGTAPHATNIIVRDYEPGVLYELFNNSDSTHVAGPYTGNIGLYVQNVTASTQYYVVGRNPDTNCETVMSTKPVVTITTPPDSVDCSTITILDKTVAAEQDTLAQGQATNIIVFNGDEGVEYELRKEDDNSFVAGPFPSNIGLYSGALYATTTFKILAIDQATQCSRELTGRVTITISDGVMSARRGNTDNVIVVETVLQFLVYPNPSAGEVDVEATDDFSGPAYVSVLDAMGNVVKTLELKREAGLLKSRLDLRPIPNGIYTLSFYRADGSMKNRRLVIRD